MKIISPFTDFYEFDAYRYGEPDQRLVWVRKTEEFAIDYHKTSDKKAIERFKLVADYKEFCNIVQGLFLSDSMGYNSSYKVSKTKNHFRIFEKLVGIYPYVYYCPQLCLYNSYWSTITIEQKYWSKDGALVDAPGAFPFILTEEDFQAKSGIEDKIKEIFPNISTFTGPGFLFPEDKFQGYQISDLHTGKKRVPKDSFKTECKKLFELINEPVFVIDKRIGLHFQTYLALKVCPNLLESSVLSWHPNLQQEQDVYNDIENFLWERKKEPISEPSNDVKIKAAGFDTKTSFRKM